MAIMRRTKQRGKWAAAMVLGLCVSLVPQMPQANAADPIGAEITLRQMEEGESGLTAIYRLEPAAGRAVTVQDITVAYDEQEIDFAGAEPLREGLQITGIAQEAGKVRIIMVSGQADAAPDPSEDMLALRWEVKAEEGHPLSEQPVALERSDFYYAPESVDGTEVPQIIEGGMLGDLDGDGQLTIADLGLLAAGEGLAEGSEEWERYAAGDVQADGVISLEDMKLLTEWMLHGQPVAQAEEVEAAVWTGDLNGDGRTSVADLAVLVNALGLTSTDENWEAVKSADSNGNGVIDSEDLAALVQLILNPNQ